MARSFASRIGILAGVELQLGADKLREGVFRPLSNAFLGAKDFRWIGKTDGSYDSF